MDPVIEGKTALAIANLKEQFGDDIVVYTPQEAKEQGLVPSDFINTPSIKITRLPAIEVAKLHGFEKTGREKRRERRKNERKLRLNR